MKSPSSKSVIAHGDIDVVIRKSDDTIRETMAVDVANSPSLTVSGAWETLAGTYDWPGYAVVDQTDYLEVAYYIEVTASQQSKSVSLLVDDGALPVADQTKIENVMFTYPNQSPVASFTYSPPDPAIYETVTFNASTSYDPYGSIVSYTWDFGDGNITTVTNPIIAHIYTTVASVVNYTVTLTVTDNEGSTGFATQIVPVTNPAILHVSLPDGTYVGANPDKWLDECWVLNVSDNSGTFTLRINNTSGKLTSYDTHLIIALNDAGYNNILNLTINTVTISKDAFRNGEPKPYNLYTWPSGDVYPTWFNDTLINVGTIPPKGYIDVTVSVVFSNATSARIHFDAYGSKNPVPPPPDEHGKVTHNPLSQDSTVLFWPPVVKYQLTVRTSGLGTYITNVYNGTTLLGTATDAAPYTGLFEEDSLILLNIDSPITDGSKRFVFTQWSGDATGTNRPVSVTMNTAKDITANYKTQYYLTVNTNPAEVLTLNPAAVSGQGWYDSGFTATVDAVQNVDKVASQSRYDFRSWTGATPTGVGNQATVLMDGSKTATANYKLQYKITFNQFGVGTDFTGTVVIIDGTNYGVGSLPAQFWWDDDSIHNFAFQSPLVVTPNAKQHVWTSTTGLSTLQSGSITVSGSGSITGNYKTQYYLTVSSPYGSPTPTSGWFDAETSITASVTSPWPGPEGTRYVCTGWTGTGSVPASGTTPSVSFVISEPSSVTWNWKTQYYLTVQTDPAGIVTIPGEDWYDESTSVTLTAPTVPNYQFNYWDVDGTSQGVGVNPITVHMDAPHTATAHYTEIPPLSVSISPTTAKIKIGESVTFTSSVSGGEPPYGYQWYLNGNAVPGATSASWTFVPESTGSYVVYLVVTDSLANTAQSDDASVNVAPQLMVSISPTSAEIFVGESVEFTSTVSGGYEPYSYQWYLNDNPVSGATLASWPFKPTSEGNYYIYLKVTDAEGNVVRSDTSRITVIPVPIGGYSVSLSKGSPTLGLINYTVVTALFGVALSLLRRKRK